MHKVTAVEVLEGYRLKLTFDDGRQGVVDVSHLVGKGVFSIWSDYDVFRKVRIGESGELMWGDQVDLCPDSLYLQATGQRPEELPRMRELLRQQLPLLSERYGVASRGVFGSYVRHEQQAGSDLDVLVSFRETPGLFRFIELENYLSDLLGVRVDLVMADALKPRIQRRVLAEVVPV